MDFKTILLIVCLFAVGLSLAFWGGRCSREQAQYIEPPMPEPPPVVISPNPAPAVVDKSPELIKRVDSLIHAQARERARGLAIGDSLAAVMAYKDSLLMVRSLPARSEQRLEARDPTGILITGNLRIIHEPISMTTLSRVKLDTVKVPARIVTQVVTETNPYLVIGAVVVGAAGGMWLHSRMK